MVKLLWYLRGYWAVEITGAAPEWMLNRLSSARIPFWNLRRPDAFTLQLCIFPRDLTAVEHLAEKAMCRVEQSRQMGFLQLVGGVLHRPVLLILLALTLGMIAFAQNFLLFYSVSGNETISSQQILQNLEQIGVGFGQAGAGLDPKWIKDHMLQAMPQLQWVTVTQNGALAQVVVRERPETPQIQSRKGYANVIAAQSGIITGQYVLAGQALRQVGDTVLQGELLVSGIVDLERTYLMQHAQAEIYARTWRQMQAATPSEMLQKMPSSATNRCIWLEIGKLRIKIFGNSGISTTACDKMISRKILSLPGGFTLPVSVLTEVCRPYEVVPVRMEPEQAQTLLADSIRAYVWEHMRAGEIRKENLRLQTAEGRYELDAVLECHEMIAETVEAKWNEEDFAND